MMKKMVMQEAVRVLEQLEDGYTKVLLLRTESKALVEWEIPTEVIPQKLRAVGQKFTLKQESWVPENDAEMKQIGKHPPRYTVEP